MSLIVNEGAGMSIPLLAEDVYPAVCTMLVDLGEQYSEQFGNSRRQVCISWELPGELLENGEPRRLSNTYTANLNSKGNLRKDLISWRGRDFTPEELKEFDLRNIVGAPCMLSVIHKVRQDGSKRAVVGGIMKLPKGMPVPKPTAGTIVYDLDEPGAVERVGQLPEWMEKRIKESETWKALLDEAGYAATEERAKAEELGPPPTAEQSAAFVDELNDTDGELPF